MKKTKLIRKKFSVDKTPSFDKFFENIMKRKKAMLLEIRDKIGQMYNKSLSPLSLFDPAPLFPESFSYDIGEVLTEAKEIVPRKQYKSCFKYLFLKYLSYTKANSYVRIYSTFYDVSRLAKEIPTKYLIILSQDQFPSRLLKLIKRRYVKYDNKSLENLSNVYKQFKKYDISESQFLRLTFDLIKLDKEELGYLHVIKYYEEFESYLKELEENASRLNKSQYNLPIHLG